MTEEKKKQIKKLAGSVFKIAGLVLLAYLVVRYVFMPGSLQPVQFSMSGKEPPKSPDAKIGHLFPPLEFQVPGRSKVNLSGFKVKVILLNFFGTWCPPCRFEMPSFEKLYREFAPEGFTVVAVTVDESEDAVEQFIKDVGVTFTVGIADPSQAEGYRIHGFPTTFLIDKRGVIREIIPGAIDWKAKVVKERIKGLLQE